MKKIIITLSGIFLTCLVFSQTSTVLSPSAKIKLSNGQKIVVKSIVAIEASLGMGMEITSNSTTENALDVKNSTDKNYTISNTLTKLKVNMNAMGQPTNYDSEKNYLIFLRIYFLISRLNYSAMKVQRFVLLGTESPPYLF